MDNYCRPDVGSSKARQILDLGAWYSAAP
ncbi:hypothetical protein LINPERPRIM_LOCUS40669 [Linum perenne]